MSQTEVVAANLRITKRHARRLLAAHDSRAFHILQDTDPNGLAIRRAIEGICYLLEEHSSLWSNLVLAIASRKGELKHLPIETRRLIKRAMSANLAIQNAAWAAIQPWHELDCATLNTGKLADKCAIVKECEREEMQERQPTHQKESEHEHHT